MLILLACAAPSPADTAPEAATDTDTDTDTDIDTDSPCDDTVATTGRPTEFGALIARLEEQGCLDDPDEDALVAYIDDFYAAEDIWCDAVWRLTSTDGVTFTGTPELVREHASVPDVRIEGGDHILVFNELTPGIFAQTLRDDPARFWRQGLIGVGGLGIARDSGEGFMDEAIDLHLPELRLLIDPDLSAGPLPRLVNFQIDADTLDGTTWDPALSTPPHSFYRATSTSVSEFPAPTLVAQSGTGSGGFDPTVLDLPDGEILYVGAFDAPLLGWTAPGGVYPAVGTLPDVVTELGAAAPDVVVDPAGGYRLYAYDPRSGNVYLATSDDGQTWAPVGPITDASVGPVSNPSVARDETGVWWLYYTQRLDSCLEGRK